jgi:hypothetical protein
MSMLEGQPSLPIVAADTSDDIQSFVWKRANQLISERRLLNGKASYELKQHITGALISRAGGMYVP